ncbi:MAG: hypothetical protein ABIS35_04520 [Terracoccus sp.]
MKLYADTSARRSRQVIADVLVLLWVGVWAWVGRGVHDLIAELQTPADSISRAGTSVHDALTGAGGQAAQLPFVGGSLRDWLVQAAGSGTTLQTAGTTMSSTIGSLALVAGWITALVPILLVAGVWLFVRVRFVRRATSAQRFIDSNEDLDLFALRAMANQPMTALARISADPAGAWRRRDPEVIRALASLELRNHGLRPPRR